MTHVWDRHSEENGMILNDRTIQTSSDFLKCIKTTNDTSLLLNYAQGANYLIRSSKDHTTQRGTQQSSWNKYWVQWTTVIRKTLYTETSNQRIFFWTLKTLIAFLRSLILVHLKFMTLNKRCIRLTALLTTLLLRFLQATTMKNVTSGL